MLYLLPIGPPVVPTNIIVTNITGTSAVITWTIPYVAFTFEQYRVQYGLDFDSLLMSSEVLYSGPGFNAVNETYSITLTNLNPLSQYYFKVEASNSEESSNTSIMMFTTVEDGKYNIELFS